MKKTKIRITSFLVLLCTILSVVTVADSVYTSNSIEASAFPDISAQSFILADAQTGEVLFAHNEDQRMPVASTTKILTCLIVLEEADINDTVKVTAESCGVEGSSIYLYEGEELTVKDLLYGLMLESANDAATCLAIHVSGSVDSFSDLMNKKAQELGLSNSHFNNPHGLEDPEHYSTARDMSILWSEAMENEEFRRIVSTKTYRIDIDNEDGYRFLSNHNRLLKTFESCIGGKTGYTKTAGRCLVTGAERDGVELVMVTLNDPNDWADHEALIDYAFSLYTKVELATPGSITHTVSMVGGNKKSIKLKNVDSLSVSLRDISSLKTSLETPRFIYAPITDTDTPVARVIYTVNGETVATLPLYPEKTVEVMKKPSFFKRIFNIFK